MEEGGSPIGEKDSTYGRLLTLLAVVRYQQNRKLTRHDVARIHRVLVLNEAKAIHQLDLSDIPGAMGREMGLNISLGRYNPETIVRTQSFLGRVVKQCAPMRQSSEHRRAGGIRT